MRDAGTFSFPALPESLSAARNCVRGVLQSLDRADKEMDVNIVVGEILQNIIRYGFDGGSKDGTFTIQFAANQTDLVITVTDNAPPSDPTSWSNAHRKPEEGGHGLTLVQAIVKDVHLSMLDDGNRAELHFALQELSLIHI